MYCSLAENAFKLLIKCYVPLLGNRTIIIQLHLSTKVMLPHAESSEVISNDTKTTGCY